MALSTDVKAARRQEIYEHESGAISLRDTDIGTEHGSKTQLPLRARRYEPSGWQWWWAVLLVVGLLSLVGYFVLWREADVTRSTGAYWSYLGVFGVLFILYLFACYLVLSAGKVLPIRPTLVLIGVVSVVARVALITAPPTLSNDVYRYVWDGRVRSFGISPYQYPPNAPQLASLRSPDYDRELWQYINRKNAITVYPAGAEMFYAGVYRLIADNVTAMKSAIVIVDLVNCLALGLMLSVVRMSPARSIVYAWSPLPIVEFGGSGHVEALSVLCTLLALLAGAMVIRRYGAGAQKRLTPLSLLAAVCLGAAMLVKIIPTLLLVGWLRQFGWRFAVTSGAIFGIVSVIFINAYGGYVSPFLATYLVEEESNAPLYYLLKYGVSAPLGMPDGLVRVLLAGLLVGVALYIMIRREWGPYDFIGKSFLLVAAYLFLATSAHSWYATWLLLFLPMFLPPNGLPIFGSIEEVRDTGRRKRSRFAVTHGVAFAALAFTGLTFLGYLVFAMRTPILPWPIVALQFTGIVGLAVMWPLWRWLSEKRNKKVPFAD